MAVSGARAEQPIEEIRFLADLDKEGQGKTNFDNQQVLRSSGKIQRDNQGVLRPGADYMRWSKPEIIKEGIKISANLNVLQLFFCQFFGMTVNIEIGDKTYACGRSSLEHFLRRHATEAGLSNKIGEFGNKGRLNYSDLANGLKNLLENKKVQASIRKQVVKAAGQSNPRDPTLQLYKDLAEVSRQPSKTVRILDASDNGFLSASAFQGLMREANLQPSDAPAAPIPQPISPRRASVAANAIPVPAAVAAIASAAIAAPPKSPAARVAQDVIALAQRKPEAVAALQQVVDDEYIPRAPDAPAVDNASEQQAELPKKSVNEIIRENREASRGQPQQAPTQLTPQQVAREAAKQANQRQRAVPQSKALPEYTKDQFRLDRSRTQVPQVNARVQEPTVEVSRIKPQLPSRPAPSRPQAAPVPSVQPSVSPLVRPPRLTIPEDEEGPYIPRATGEMTPSLARSADMSPQSLAQLQKNMLQAERVRQASGKRLEVIRPYLLTDSDAIRKLESHIKHQAKIPGFEQRFAFVEKEDGYLWLYFVDDDGDVLKREVDLTKGFLVVPEGQEEGEPEVHADFKKMISSWVGTRDNQKLGKKNQLAAVADDIPEVRLPDFLPGAKAPVRRRGPKHMDFGMPSSAPEQPMSAPKGASAAPAAPSSSSSSSSAQPARAMPAAVAASKAVQTADERLAQLKPFTVDRNNRGVELLFEVDEKAPKELWNSFAFTTDNKGKLQLVWAGDDGAVYARAVDFSKGFYLQPDTSIEEESQPYQTVDELITAWTGLKKEQFESHRLDRVWSRSQRAPQAASSSSSSAQSARVMPAAAAASKAVQTADERLAQLKPFTVDRNNRGVELLFEVDEKAPKELWNSFAFTTDSKDKLQLVWAGDDGAVYARAVDFSKGFYLQPDTSIEEESQPYQTVDELITAWTGLKKEQFESHRLDRVWSRSQRAPQAASSSSSSAQSARIMPAAAAASKAVQTADERLAQLKPFTVDRNNRGVELLFEVDEKAPKELWNSFAFTTDSKGKLQLVWAGDDGAVYARAVDFSKGFYLQPDTSIEEESQPYQTVDELITAWTGLKKEQFESHRLDRVWSRSQKAPQTAFSSSAQPARAMPAAANSAAAHEAAAGVSRIPARAQMRRLVENDPSFLPLNNKMIKYLEDNETASTALNNHYALAGNDREGWGVYWVHGGKSHIAAFEFIEKGGKVWLSVSTEGDQAPVLYDNIPEMLKKVCGIGQAEKGNLLKGKSMRSAGQA